MSIKIVVQGSKLSHEFQVSILSDISGLKRMIAEWCGVEVERQGLFQGGLELGDNLPFKHHPAVKDCSEMELKQVVLTLSLKVMFLVGDPEFDILFYHKSRPNSPIEYKVRETESVAEVKERLAMQVAIHYSRTVMSHLGFNMDNDCILHDYYVCPGSRIEFYDF